MNTHKKVITPQPNPLSPTSLSSRPRPFKAGKVMPIKRGGGLDQPSLLSFARRVASGHWVHLFPEGKVFQSGSLGADYYNARTDAEASDPGGVGRLKWGVGKVLAHSPVPVVVLPFHHVGMDGVVPQYETGELKTKVPLGGNAVTVRFGAAIHLADLIDDHERRHGTLHKYSAVKNEESDKLWPSTDAEKRLYCRIARRIEDKLVALEKEAKEDKSEDVRKGYENLATNRASCQVFDRQKTTKNG